ncbi:MFS transporter [Paeniglutamicibacter terrestris]|uniref:MFS transporter n=1 Tax=Paeniglutamicibacter terrestris TaxID=2723403 RepID=A0ABX1G8T1_9MICC|nr:MFS transporter [Paeniglutamicibacter terrestris]NKG22668.1 MFS transporter [Paeniglutamicibacter terrestris]
MSNSDTWTSSAPQESQLPQPKQPDKASGPVNDSAANGSTKKSTKTAPPEAAGPTDLIRANEESSHNAPVGADEHVSARISHPVPRQHTTEPDSLNTLLKGSANPDHADAPLHHLASKDASKGAKSSSKVMANADEKEAAMSGGFPAINGWLDSLPNPAWEKLGDKIYATPSTLKQRWQQQRVERAKAAELKERNRLVEVARAEAAAEAAKREAARVAREEAIAREAAAKAQAEADAEAAEKARVAAEAKAAADAELAEKAKAAAATQAAIDAAIAEKARVAAEAKAAAAMAEEAQLAGATEFKEDPETGLHARNLFSAPDAGRAPEEPASQWDDSPLGDGQRSKQHYASQPMGAEQLAELVASAKAAIDKQQATVEPLYEAPYALPETGENPEEVPADKRRRILLSIAAVVASVVSLICLSTLASGSVESLGSNYSLLSTAPSAHLLWPLIFVWSALSAAYSWTATQRSAVRQRLIGLPFTLAIVAGTLWMISAVNDWLLPAFVFSAASCWFLYTAVRGLNEKTARNHRERMLTDAPISLMTGFTLVVTASSFASLLQSWGADWAVTWVAPILVIATGYAAVALAMTERGRIILAIGFSWGMFWLLVPRAVGSHSSIWIAILAGMACFVALLATENRRYQIHHAEHRAARGKPTEFD